MIPAVGIFCAAVISAVCADLIGYSLPKNLPAKISSKWDATDNAMLANNGDTGGSYSASVRCCHAAGGDMQPWWMLDMQTLRLISGVRVWNRVDCCAEKFQKITIGVSNNATAWSSFSLSLFDVCHYYAGIPTSAQNPLSFTCTRPVAGRYLALHKNGAGMSASDAYFHICEVDVFTFVKAQPHHMQDVEPSFSDTAAPSLTELAPLPPVRSLADCAMQCGLNPTCLYALYGSGGQCHLFQSPDIPSSFRDGFIAGGGGGFVGVIG